MPTSWIKDLKALVAATPGAKVKELVVFRSPQLKGKSEKESQEVLQQVLKEFTSVCRVLSRAFGECHSRQMTEVNLDPTQDYQMYSWLKASRVVDWMAPKGVRVFAAIRHQAMERPFEIVVGVRYSRLPVQKKKRAGKGPLDHFRELLAQPGEATRDLKISKDFFDDSEDELTEQTEQFLAEWEGIVQEVSSAWEQAAFQGTFGEKRFPKWAEGMFQLAVWKRGDRLAYAGVEQEDRELPLVLKLGVRQAGRAK